MNFELLDWHWLVFGMALLLAEMFAGSFFILWFALGALLVALLLWLNVPLGFPGQVLAWTLFSGACTFLWFRYLRPRMRDRTKAGISREAVLGESGQVLRAPDGGQRGRVRFTTPLLGDDEWEFICAAGSVAPGDRVVVKDISGNTLIVEKRP